MQTKPSKQSRQLRQIRQIKRLKNQSTWCSWSRGSYAQSMAPVRRKPKRVSSGASSRPSSSPVGFGATEPRYRRNEEACRIAAEIPGPGWYAVHRDKRLQHPEGGRLESPLQSGPDCQRFAPAVKRGTEYWPGPAEYSLVNTTIAGSRSVGCGLARAENDTFLDMVSTPVVLVPSVANVLHYRAVCC